MRYEARGGDRGEGGWGKWAAVVFIGLLAAVFSYLNGQEAVALNFGVFVLYQVSLVGLVFVAFLLGMVTMFLVGLRHDLKVRRLLRERRLDLPPPDHDP